MKLGDLARAIPGAQLVGDGSVEISSLLLDSRKKSPGALFAALPGVKADGSDYIRDAVANGAAAALSSRQVDGLAVPQIISADPRLALSKAAEAFYGNPSRKLKLVGVTGTNGKTTTAFILRHICHEIGWKCGMLGTIIYDNGAESIPAPLTTPDSIEFTSALAAMADNGCRAAAVEMSSHALAQSRAGGASFAAAIYTNCTRDHLDYHLTMENYSAAKAKLFECLEHGATAAINKDDPYCMRMARDCRAKMVWYSLKQKSDLTATVESMTLAGSVCQLDWKGRGFKLQTPLVGRHNIQNILGALIAAEAIGLDAGAAVAALGNFGGAPGRLERVIVPGMNEKPAVFVDYAHTDDALRNVLEILRQLGCGKLHVVFGCGGDRDRGKRPLMAKAAEALADQVVVTSDNPRTESPEQIFSDIRAGFVDAAKPLFEPDRKHAVELAVRNAKPGDIVLLAGKGHEDYQIIGTKKIHLDDRELASAALAAY